MPATKGKTRIANTMNTAETLMGPGWLRIVLKRSLAIPEGVVDRLPLLEECFN